MVKGCVWKLPLTRGLFAVVDADDFARLDRFRWHAHKSGPRFYAGRTVGGKADRCFVYLHREILGLLPGEWGDHVNGNTLDNRRANLRRCSPTQNHMNAVKRCDGRSEYRGVYHHTQSTHGWNRWVAQIKCDGKRRSLGCFRSAELAAKAYDKVARAAFGAFARVNFPRNGERGCLR